MELTLKAGIALKDFVPELYPPFLYNLYTSDSIKYIYKVHELRFDCKYYLVLHLKTVVFFILPETSSRIDPIRLSQSDICVLVLTPETYPM